MKRSMANLVIPCAKCSGKGVGVFKCQGCSHVFCRKHASDHRDSLNHQLDELVYEHDQLHQLISQENNEYSTILTQIEQWEQDAIHKIQQVAKNIRQEIAQHIRSKKEIASETLKYLSHRLRQAREEDDYMEDDLHRWTLKLDSLKNDLAATYSCLTLHQDSKESLIPAIHLSLVRSATMSNETFLRSVGDIQIEDHGQVAIHGEQKRSDAFLCGKNEYSKGKHKIRFIVNKRDADYITTFGIVSTSSQSSIYGWSSDDQTIGGGYCQSKKNLYNQRDMKDEITLQIEFFIDCDNRTISYFNERTGCKKEMNVDPNLCPFPWQLYFYLYDAGDRVRLLSPNRI